MKTLAIVSFCLVVSVVLAIYGGDRKEKRDQRRADERTRDVERWQTSGRRSAQERTEAAERAQTEGTGPYAASPRAPVEPVKKEFTKEAFDREQERRDAETRRRVEHERRDYENERSRREYEAAIEEERARRNALIKEE